MNERLPSVCLVMFCVVGLFVMYQAVVGTEGSPPEIVSYTLYVPAIRWPQPPGTPAGAQSSPPGIPPWNKSHGRMKDWVSPPHLARPTVRLLTHRDTPPLLFPPQNLRLDPVPTGSFLAKNPSPPKPSCHC